MSLVAEQKVIAFSGSTRSDSYNKKLVLQASEIAKQMGATVTVIDLKDYPIPFYDGDLEDKKGLPKKAKQLRDLMKSSDAMIIASPEYNGSVSAILKNTLDWMSRGEKGGYSPEAFKGKKFAIMSASPGNGGGARGLAHLKQIIENAGGEVVPTKVSIKQAQTAFNEKGVIINPAVKKELQAEIRELLQTNSQENNPWLLESED
ncbi:MAG TPA: NAD(P)H-dependent oxidoreductase [Chlamydiales bacterium]|nr:NAD(P)H-dependent oxidoreductase [Chlamydiales bacterium]